ncbi:MAG: cyclic nucleotide-binding domain-containing protein [Proteobacteria bacterium]|nr:cyclic nucleotide-binding domain-containing protein [Pseudomonadota bacterium]MBU1738479.1 cyclic nucleotide-binding domain-containing protein [Pseudomonadota bacterium]
MKPEERVKYLSTIDLFEHFSHEELSNFAEKVQEVRINADEVLFHEGAPGDDMYILLDGQLKVNKDAKFITNIKPVEYIGEMAIIESKPRSATVQAVLDSTLLKITSAQFQEYFSTQPESLVSLMRTLSHRIRRNTEIIAEEFEKANILIHDMKNQMASFLFLDLMARETKVEGQLRLLKVMQNSRDNLTAMMAEALALAKRQNLPRSYKIDSLQEMMHEVRDSEVTAHPDLKDREVNFVFGENVPQIFFCRVEMHRALVNLLLNAAQASPNGGPIDVELSTDNGNGVIRVMDRGTGIPEKIRARIFDTHFTTKENGNGLGLASCRNVVERLHGGELSFHDRDGGGTVFTMALPLKSDSCFLDE